MYLVNECLPHVLITIFTIHARVIFFKGRGVIGGSEEQRRESPRFICLVTLFCKLNEFEFSGVQEFPYPPPNIWIRAWHSFNEISKDIIINQKLKNLSEI